MRSPTSATIKYLTVVVDHDTGRLVWAGVGGDKTTVRTFFDALGPERCAQITHVSADGATWISEVVAERCPQAVRCADPFHVVKWATNALDEVRRQAWNTARGDTRTLRAPLGGEGQPLDRTRPSAEELPGSRCGRTPRT